MKYRIPVGDTFITLEHGSLDSNINVDDLTVIDTGNLFGEAVTISTATNRIGLLKAELERQMSKAKLNVKIFEGKYRARLRGEASRNAGKVIIELEGEEITVKVTEKFLETCFEMDEEWIKVKNEFIDMERNWNALSSLYWACQDKSRKLNSLVNGTTPQDFIAGVVAGKINGLLITK